MYQIIREARSLLSYYIYCAITLDSVVGLLCCKGCYDATRLYSIKGNRAGLTLSLRLRMGCRLQPLTKGRRHRRRRRRLAS